MSKMGGGAPDTFKIQKISGIQEEKENGENFKRKSKEILFSFF